MARSKRHRTMWVNIYKGLSKKDPRLPYGCPSWTQLAIDMIPHMKLNKVVYHAQRNYCHDLSIDHPDNMSLNEWLEYYPQEVLANAMREILDIIPKDKRDTIFHRILLTDLIRGRDPNSESKLIDFIVNIENLLR